MTDQITTNSPSFQLQANYNDLILDSNAYDNVCSPSLSFSIGANLTYIRNNKPPLNLRLRQI
jgi:hypothetical protein